MPKQPSGTVTFLFTDIEDSSQRWESSPVQMRTALEHHDRILRASITAHEGYVFTTAGDSFAVAFTTAEAAAEAALDIQHQLAIHHWDPLDPMRVRIGLHTGEADERDGDFFGPAVNLVARIEAAGRGGQVLTSSVTAGVLAESTRSTWQITNLGDYALKGIERNVSICQLDQHEYVDFGPLRIAQSSGAGGQPPRDSRSNPYKGLRAFHEADTDDFYGRDQLTDQLVAAIGETRFLAVVGPSGSGKSSAVRAGLVPRLRNSTIAGSSGWSVATLIPGERPFEELEAGLLKVAPGTSATLLGQLEDGDRGVIRAIKRLLPDDGSELVLFIDQFEELFTLPDASTRDRFLDSLAELVSDPGARTRVVCTIRADYYDRPLEHPTIGALVRDNTVAITPLSASELVETITSPAAALGVEFDDDLVERIVTDVRSSPGSLPMLQYTLTELFTRRIGNRITASAYEQLGGIGGAITARAEDVYGRLGPDEQHATQRVFGRLVHLSDRAETTRRRVRRRDLGQDRSTAIAIDAFNDARLLVLGQPDGGTDDPTVEVAHEALITEWDRLQAWIDDDREQLRVLAHLSAAATAWESRGRDSGDLYRGTRLEAARAVSADFGELSVLEEAFVQASEAAAVSELNLEVRRNRRLRILTAVSALIACLALGAGAMALRQRDRADDNAARAERIAYDTELRRMAADAVNLRTADPALSFLTAAAVHQIDDGLQSVAVLQRTLTRTDGLLGFVGSSSDYVDIDFADDLTLLARSSDGIDVWDLGQREMRFSVPVTGAGWVRALSPSVALIADADGSMMTLDLTSGETGAFMQLSSSGIRDIDVDVESSTIATLTGRNAIDLVDLDLDEIDRLEIRNDDSDLETPPSAVLLRRVAVGSAGVIGSYGPWLVGFDRSLNEVWRSDATEVTVRFQSVVVDQDSGTAIAHTPGIGVWTFDAADGSLIDSWPSESDLSGLTVRSGVIFAGGDIIDVAAGTVRNGPDARPSDRLTAVSPSGSLVAYAGSEGVVLYSLDGSQLLARAAPANSAASVSIDRSRTVLALGGGAAGVREILWDLDAGGPMDASTDTVINHAWLPSGAFMTQDVGGETRVAAAVEGPLIGAVPPQLWAAFSSSPTNDIAIVGPPPGGRQGEMDVYSLTTSERIESVSVFPPTVLPLTRITFSPDGTLVAVVTQDGSFAIVDATSWEVTHAVESTADRNVVDAVFARDGRSVLILTTHGEIALFDLESERFASVGSAPSRGAATGMSALAVRPDGQTVAVGVEAGVQLWSLGSGLPVGGLFPNNDLPYGSPSHDGMSAMTSVDGHVHVWNLDIDNWVDVACQAAGRDMTLEEWEQYGHPGEPYRSVCPQG